MTNPLQHRSWRIATGWLASLALAGGLGFVIAHEQGAAAGQPPLVAKVDVERWLLRDWLPAVVAAPGQDAAAVCAPPRKALYHCRVWDPAAPALLPAWGPLLVQVAAPEPGVFRIVDVRPT